MRKGGGLAATSNRDYCFKADSGNNPYVVHNFPSRVKSAPRSTEQQIRTDNQVIAIIVKVVKAVLIGFVYPFYILFSVIPNWIVAKCTYPAQVCYRGVLQFLSYLNRRFVLPVRRFCAMVHRAVISPVFHWICSTYQFYRNKVVSFGKKVWSRIQEINRTLLHYRSKKSERFRALKLRPQIVDQLGHGVGQMLSGFSKRMTRTKVVATHAKEKVQHFATRIQHFKLALFGFQNRLANRIHLFSLELSQRLYEVCFEIRQRFIG